MRVEVIQVPVTPDACGYNPMIGCAAMVMALVVIPAGSLSQVLAAAEEIHQAEEHIRAAMEACVPLRQARAADWMTKKAAAGAASVDVEGAVQTPDTLMAFSAHIAQVVN